MMKSRERFYLIFGALAGAAAGYWLNSKRGKETRSNIAETSTEQMKKMKTYVSEEVGTIKSHAGELIQKSIDLAKEAMQNVQDETNDVSTSMSDSFAKGVAKAKQAIDDLENQLEKENKMS